MEAGARHIYMYARKRECVCVREILRHTRTRCHTLEDSATHVETGARHMYMQARESVFVQYCNTLQHTATHYTLQHNHYQIWCLLPSPAAKHCNTLQNTATHCNTLQNTATHCTIYLSNFSDASARTGCKTLQHSATHCNTLQHPATLPVWLQRCLRSNPAVSASTIRISQKSA